MRERVDKENAVTNTYKFIFVNLSESCEYRSRGATTIMGASFRLVAQWMVANSDVIIIFCLLSFVLASLPGQWIHTRKTQRQGETQRERHRERETERDQRYTLLRLWWGNGFHIVCLHPKLRATHYNLWSCSHDITLQAKGDQNFIPTMLYVLLIWAIIFSRNRHQCFIHIPCGCPQNNYSPMVSSSSSHCVKKLAFFLLKFRLWAE